MVASSFWVHDHRQVVGPRYIRSSEEWIASACFLAMTGCYIAVQLRRTVLQSLADSRARSETLKDLGGRDSQMVGESRIALLHVLLQKFGHSDEKLDP